MAKLKTGRHTSALKAQRQSVRRHIANTDVITRLRNLVKKIEGAVAKKDVKLAKELLTTAFSEWDKAARRNVIHDNKAANQKARLSKMVHSISGQA